MTDSGVRVSPHPRPRRAIPSHLVAWFPEGHLPSLQNHQVTYGGLQQRGPGVTWILIQMASCWPLTAKYPWIRECSGKRESSSWEEKNKNNNKRDTEHSCPFCYVRTQQEDSCELKTSFNSNYFPKAPPRNSIRSGR